MGNEVVEPPEDENDADFDGLLLASNAQTAEFDRLATGFRRGFPGRSPYNLKDLLVEIVLSRWFRAESFSEDDPTRALALRDAGAKRLLTPEELARKTEAVTGFQWGRRRDIGVRPSDEHANALTRGWDYRLLYGGIDSDGITERAGDLTSVMAGVAKSHAAASSCPVVLRDFYLLPDQERRLFSGIETSISPTMEFGAAHEIEASSRTEAETLSVSGHLNAGAKSVFITFVNDFYDDEKGEDRNVWLDRLNVVNDRGQVLDSQELEELEGGECSGPTEEYYKLVCSDTLKVPISVTAEGGYEIQVLAWAEQAGDELAKVEVTVESDSQNSAGAKAIRNKLVELHEKLLGVEVDLRSDDVETAYRLFVEVWERKRQVENTHFFYPSQCDFGSDHQYFDGILDDAVIKLENEDGNYYHELDWDHVNDFMHRTINPHDHNGVARAWVVVLAYLMMDYRYLYL